MIPIRMPERSQSQVFRGEMINLSGETTQHWTRTLGQPLPWHIRLALLFVPTKTVDVFDEWTIVSFKDFGGVRYITQMRRYK